MNRFLFPPEDPFSEHRDRNIVLFSVEVYVVKTMEIIKRIYGGPREPNVLCGCSKEKMERRDKKENEKIQNGARFSSPSSGQDLVYVYNLNKMSFP